MSDPYQEAFDDVLKGEPLQQRLARERVLARRRAIIEGTFVQTPNPCGEIVITFTVTRDGAWRGTRCVLGD